MPNAILWGASSGLGNAVAHRLIADQWQVYAVARHTEKITAPTTQTYEFEAHDETSIASAVRMIAMEAETIDLMLYLAGSLAYEKIEDMTADDWLMTFHSNLTGAFHATQHTLPILAKDAHIIFIGAYLDHIQLPKMGAYVAAKAGLEQFALVLAKENRRRRVTLVRPGAVNTDFWQQVTFKMPADAKSPQSVADAIINHHNQGASGELNL